jgi:hypothetical protein
MKQNYATGPMHTHTEEEEEEDDHHRSELLLLSFFLSSSPAPGAMRFQLEKLENRVQIQPQQQQEDEVMD